uniref:Uncharacterized protein n=1 Tax=Aegilops tauschii subsp. strangulata TaxID=200361 RepID=A0A453RS18_AEGTS
AHSFPGCCNLFLARCAPSSRAHLSSSSVHLVGKEGGKIYLLPQPPSPEMRRLPAAPPRPVLHPHVSPALGVLQQHGRVAMARTTPVVCYSYLLPNRRTPSQGAKFEPLRSRSTGRDRGSAMARANPVAASGGEASPDGGRNPFAPLVELWRRTVQPLGDYGFGKRSVWEGGVGLFMVSGAA